LGRRERADSKFKIQDSRRVLGKKGEGRFKIQDSRRVLGKKGEGGFKIQDSRRVLWKVGWFKDREITLRLLRWMNRIYRIL
jgi:hypothetical protein